MMTGQDLKNLLRCMIIMGHADGFDAEEYEMIDQSFREVWQGDLQELEDFMESTINEVAGYNSQGIMQSQFEEKTMELASSLEANDKQLARNLMMNLIKADQKITGAETEFFIQFRTLLG